MSWALLRSNVDFAMFCVFCSSRIVYYCFLSGSQSMGFLSLIDVIRCGIDGGMALRNVEICDDLCFLCQPYFSLLLMGNIPISTNSMFTFMRCVFIL